jgi:thiol-disulfide isomerase/thioredoxin
MHHTSTGFETGTSTMSPASWRRAARGFVLAGLLLAFAAAGCASKNLKPLDNSSEFQKQVLEADRPVLVNFYKGGGCPTCLLVTPILNQLAEEYQGRVAFATFEIMTPLFQVRSQTLRDTYGIAFFPTTVLFVNGQERDRWIINYDINSYRKGLNAALADAPAAPQPEPAALAAAAPPASEADAPPETPGFVLAQPLRGDPESAAEPVATAGGAVAEKAATTPAPALDADLEAALLADSVLAEVNGEVITRQAILMPVQDEVRRWGRECSRKEFENRCGALVEVRVREAVIHRLLVQEAKAQLSAEEQERLKAAVADAGPAGLLGDAGTLEVAVPPVAPQSQNVKMKAEEWVLVQGFLREKIAPQVSVTQSELLAAYRQGVQERYVLPTKVRMGLIAIRKSDSATPEWAESVAKAVHSRASAGEDFAKLAQRFNRDPSAPRGGDGGFIARGSFEVKAVEDTLFGLAAGQLGPMVETPETYYIVKALDRQEGRTVPFSEVQSALEQELRDKKYNARVAGHIQELYGRWCGQFKPADLAAAPKTAAK